MRKDTECMTVFNLFPLGSYGKVLARDQPSYGCAHLNFSHPKQCAAFYREFNGKTMNDSCGFKAKLLVDFALYQEVPDYGTQRPNPLCGTYKSSVYYQEFLKKYPEFDQKVPAAPAEEIDLDNPDNEAILAEARKAASQSGMDKVIDEAARIDLSTLAPKFSEIMRPESPKTVITPLTEYVIKKLKKGRDYKMPARKDRQRDQPPKPKQPEQTRVPVKEFKTRNSQVPSEQSTIAKPESIDKPVEKSTDKPVERKSAKKQFKTESRSKAEPVARIESVAAESTIKAEPKPKQNPPKKQQKPPKPPKTEAEQPEKATPKAAPRILARKPQSEALKLEVVHQAEVKPVEPVQAQSNPKQPPVKKFAKKMKYVR